jgi:hypothetical protein
MCHQILLDPNLANMPQAHELRMPYFELSLVRTAAPCDGVMGDLTEIKERGFCPWASSLCSSHTAQTE